MRVSIFCTALLSSAFVLSHAWAETQNINVVGQVFCVQIPQNVEQRTLTTTKTSAISSLHHEDSNEVLDSSHVGALKILRKKRHSVYETERQGSGYHKKPVHYDKSDEYEAKPVYRPKQRKPSYDDDEYAPSYSKKEKSSYRPQKPSYHESDEEHGHKSYHQKPRYHKEEEESYHGSKQKYRPEKPHKYEAEASFERPSKHHSKAHEHSSEHEKPRSRKPSHGGWEMEEHSTTIQGWEQHRQKRQAIENNWIPRDIDEDDWMTRFDNGLQRADSWSDGNHDWPTNVNPGGPIQNQGQMHQQQQGDFSPEQEPEDDNGSWSTADEDDEETNSHSQGNQWSPHGAASSSNSQNGAVPPQNSPNWAQTQSQSQSSSQAQTGQVNKVQSGGPNQNQLQGQGSTQGQNQKNPPSIDQTQIKGWNSQSSNTQQQQSSSGSSDSKGGSTQDSSSWDSKKRRQNNQAQGPQGDGQYDSQTEGQNPSALAPSSPSQSNTQSQETPPQGAPVDSQQNSAYSQSDAQQNEPQQDSPSQNQQEGQYNGEENPQAQSQAEDSPAPQAAQSSNSGPSESQGPYDQASENARSDDGDDEWHFVALDGPQSDLAHPSRFRRSSSARKDFTPILVPAKAEVQLFEYDRFSSDDLLATVQTDDNGFFNISGSEAEFNLIRPYLIVKHECPSNFPEFKKCKFTTKIELPYEDPEKDSHRDVVVPINGASTQVDCE